MENKILILRKMVAEYEKTTGKKATAIYMNPETFYNSLVPSISCIWENNQRNYYFLGIPIILKNEIENGVMYVGDIMDEKMSSLETAKKIIKENYNDASHGLFDCRNTAGDRTENIYQDENIKIDICRDWEYIEVFGLTKTDFIQLLIYYQSLGGKE